MDVLRLEGASKVELRSSGMSVFSLDALFLLALEALWCRRSRRSGLPSLSWPRSLCFVGIVVSKADGIGERPLKTFVTLSGGMIAYWSEVKSARASLEACKESSCCTRQSEG